MFFNKKKKYEKKSSEELLQIYVAEEDKTAFLVLFQRYEKRLWYYFRSEISMHDDCLELIQLTYLSLLESKAFKQNSIKEYVRFLFGLAFYKKCEYYRNKSKNQQYSTDFSASPNHFDRRIIVPNRFDEPLEHEQKEEMLLALYEGINQLPSNQKTATQYQMEGLSYQQIALKMSISPTNVGTLINRAKQRLKKLLVGK